VIFLREGRREVRALGLAEELEEDGAETPERLFDARSRDGCGTIHDRLEAARVPLVIAECVSSIGAIRLVSIVATTVSGDCRSKRAVSSFAALLIKMSIGPSLASACRSSSARSFGSEMSAAIATCRSSISVRRETAELFPFPPPLVQPPMIVQT